MQNKLDKNISRHILILKLFHVLRRQALNEASHARIGHEGLDKSTHHNIRYAFRRMR